MYALAVACPSNWKRNPSDFSTGRQSESRSVGTPFCSQSLSDPFFISIIARIVSISVPQNNKKWRIVLLLLKSLARRIIASNLCRSLSVVKFRIFLSRSARENGAIRQGACEADRSNANLYSSGIVSAAPIGVNVPMTNPRATAAANQVTRVGLRSAAQKAVIALIKIRAFVSAAISQNNGNVVNHGAKFSLLPCRSKRYSALFPVRSSKQLGTKPRRKFRHLHSPQVEAAAGLIIN